MVLATSRSIFLGIRGALGFLTRLPVPQSAQTWNAFTTRPVTFPLTGYLLGLLLVFPFYFDLHRFTTGFVFVCWVYLLSGITHLDGVADFTDALVAPGDRSDKRQILTDTAVGTGGALGVAIVVLGLFSGGNIMATLPASALGIVVAAEVIAKTGITILIGFGSAFHDGLASQFSVKSTPRAVVIPLLATVPVVFLIEDITIGIGMLSTGILLAGLVLFVAQTNLGGINGDVLGTANELVRVAALHAGVIGWML